MENVKKAGVQKIKWRQKPKKTVWSSRCVIFTYFQGDVDTMVDEHFSKSLRNLKKLQGSSSSSHSENVVPSNDSSMASNQRHLSPGTKPQPEASLARDANSSGSSDKCGPKAMVQYPRSTPMVHSAYPQELWQVSSLVRQDCFGPVYSHVSPGRLVAPDVYSDWINESRLHLLHQDRYVNRPLEPPARENYHLSMMAANTGLLLNMPPGSHYCKEMFTDTCKVPVVDSQLA
ncbi:transcription cofactor vestigial-like protein 1 [Acomys russatus]|uniref:transcription cofactor vestigial-like protein 1 n=1 Tax=Acomys russatus TaxID=60746 RepID=UPI0021E2A862|nr:transcription cofactor vestigial-like protein 1 [Acomys russatus]